MCIIFFSHEIFFGLFFFRRIYYIPSGFAGAWYMYFLICTEENSLYFYFCFWVDSPWYSFYLFRVSELSLPALFFFRMLSGNNEVYFSTLISCSCSFKILEHVRFLKLLALFFTSSLLAKPPFFLIDHFKSSSINVSILLGWYGRPLISFSLQGHHREIISSVLGVCLVVLVTFFLFPLVSLSFLISALLCTIDFTFFFLVMHSVGFLFELSRTKVEKTKRRKIDKWHAGIQESIVDLSRLDIFFIFSNPTTNSPPSFFFYLFFAL